MTTHEQVEAEIRRVLDSETNAVRLSNTLFTPGGLFSKLWVTPDEKKAVIASPLFKEANHRLSELQRQEVARLTKPAAPVVLPTAGGSAEHLTPAESKS